MSERRSGLIRPQPAYHRARPTPSFGGWAEGSGFVGVGSAGDPNGSTPDARNGFNLRHIAGTDEPGEMHIRPVACRRHQTRVMVNFTSDPHP